MIRILILFTLFFKHLIAFELAQSTQTTFKLYCMYTPKFQVLYEKFFLPSIKDEFEIIVTEVPEYCPSGKIHDIGWEKVMLKKLKILEQGVKENWNNRIFFYSDVDVIFLDSVVQKALQCLGNKDFVAQQGHSDKSLCAGFLVMRGNAKTLKLIQTAYRLLEEKQCIDDQIALKKALKKFSFENISWGLLPLTQFANGCYVLKKSHENIKDPIRYSFDSLIELPEPIVMFHATFCLGLKNKLHFLRRVQEEYLSRKTRFLKSD